MRSRASGNYHRSPFMGGSAQSRCFLDQTGTKKNQIHKIRVVLVQRERVLRYCMRLKIVRSGFRESVGV